MASFTSGARSKGAAAFLSCALLLACGASAPPATSARPGRRVILVGLDAGDWLAIDPLLAQGKLPFFARLRNAGRTGTMLSEPPLLSPILWTTIATGRPPEEHGVLDFMVDLPGGGQAPVGATSRRVPALWNLFSSAGRSVAVVGWWASWPAEAVRGTLVSDRIAPQLTRSGGHPAAGAISPASAASRLMPGLVRADQITLEELRAWLPVSSAEFATAQHEQASGRFYDDPVAHLSAIIAATRSYSALAENLLRSEDPDFLAVYLEAVDTVSHRFVRDVKRGPEAIEAAYRAADLLLGRLAAAAPSDTWIIVCSDHGFQPADAGVTADPSDLAGPATAWHRPYGIVGAIEAGVLSGRSPAPPAQRVPDVTPVDIAPTVLHAAGLPITERMRGRIATALLPPDRAAQPAARIAVPDAGPAGDPAAGGDDAELAARLRALGYIGASTTSLARQNLGEILYRHGNLPAAERELRAVAESQPQNLAALLWLARVLRDQKRFRESLEVSRRALSLPGGADESLVVAIDMAVDAGMAGDARRLVDALQPVDRNRPAASVARAILARADGDPVRAERQLRAALTRDPLCFDALSRLLDALPSRPAKAAALPLFRRAAEGAPSSPRHLALFGAALLGSGRPAEAEPVLARALSLAPESDALRLDLSRSQLGQRKAEAALATLDTAKASTERALLRGATYSMLSRWADAEREYREALAATPQAPDLLNALAWAELQQGRKIEAAELIRRSLALDANQPQIRGLLASLPSPGARP